MNKDERTGHPVSEGVGAAGGAVTGLAVGASVGGPVGAVVGAAIGAVAGGVAGHGVAAAMDPAVEDEYWSTNFQSRPYVRDGAQYNEYRDAYRYGGETRASSTSTWDSSASEIEAGWDKAKGGSRLVWRDAKDAVRDGWNRVERAIPGDADGDGR